MRFQFRTHENGGVCCSSINSRGERSLPTYPCDKCVAFFAAQEQEDSVKALDDAAPDPLGSYGPGIAALRAAETTTIDAFEHQWKRSRLEALEAEYARRDAANAAGPRVPRLTAAELASAKPPDPYAEGIRKLRESR